MELEELKEELKLFTLKYKECKKMYWYHTIEVSKNLFHHLVEKVFYWWEDCYHGYLLYINTSVNILQLTMTYLKTVVVKTNIMILSIVF